MNSRETLHRAILSAYKGGNRLMLVGPRRSGRLAGIREALPASTAVHVLDLSLACDDAGVDFAANRLSASKGEGYPGLVSNLVTKCEKAKQVLVVHNIDGPSCAEVGTAVTGYVRSHAQVARGLPIFYTASREQYLSVNVAAVNAPLLRQTNIVHVPPLADDEIAEWAAEMVAPVDPGYVKLLGGSLYEDLKPLLTLAHQISGDPQKALTEAAVQIAENRHVGYSHMASCFLTPNFLRVLMAMARGAPGRAGGELARVAGIPLGSLSTSLQRLHELEILSKGPEGYSFSDPFFRAWLLRGQKASPR